MQTGSAITGNTNIRDGGGVYLSSGTFNMRGGTITGNRAEKEGGGIGTWQLTLNKTGGTITGYGSDPNNGNMVGDDSGPIARKGHAVFATDSNYSTRKIKVTQTYIFFIYRLTLSGAWAKRHIGDLACLLQCHVKASIKTC